MTRLVFTMALLTSIAACGDSTETPPDPPGSHQLGEHCAWEMNGDAELCAEGLSCVHLNGCSGESFCAATCQTDADCPIVDGLPSRCSIECMWPCEQDSDCPSSLAVDMICSQDAKLCTRDCHPEPTG